MQEGETPPPALTGRRTTLKEAIVVRAEWNGVVIAESDDTILVEGNHYFPRASVREEYLAPVKLRTLCPWKGVARYYALVVNGARLDSAAWYYPKPWPLGRKVKDRIAFWGGVEIKS